MIIYDVLLVNVELYVFLLVLVCILFAFVHTPLRVVFEKHRAYGT